MHQVTVVTIRVATKSKLACHMMGQTMQRRMPDRDDAQRIKNYDFRMFTFTEKYSHHLRGWEKTRLNMVV